MVRSEVGMVKAMASRPRKWPLRRTFAFVLIASGLFWGVVGVALRFLLF